MLTTAAGAMLWSGSALAQDAPAAAETSGVGEIIVTAQKRSESVNKVGMSINAVSSDALLQQGVGSPADLVRIVPGFQTTEAPRGTPIYSIRGIGFDDSTLGSNSTVALYVDEVPLTFAPEARFATLDLERVEVLKGPQGILFGQNSTGGAINFIAAKPTDEPAAGFDATYGLRISVQ
ncbi:TonB-dependent receptor plug domain-containing protein [Sphingopyxis sp.]|uniref:TonB-dependent receptor plug domain-containing protein n=1 Tax=Sphingopyxis sp. TaxID=1908224 RepID=UPI0035B3B0C9